MLDGKRTPATKRCNISWCAPHRFGCEAATRLELEARTILRGDHKNVESLDPFRKSSAAVRTNSLRRLLGFVSSWPILSVGHECLIPFRYSTRSVLFASLRFRLNCEL